MAKSKHGLNIISLNVRGLRDTKKRSDCFFWLKEKHFDICLLQETYWTPDIEPKILKEWGKHQILNFGTSHSKGTAVLFSAKFEIINYHKSEDSRIILINFKINEDIMTLINIYAPNNISERKSFFCKIQKWIEKHAMNEQNLIIGGDFNVTEENNLDRHTNACNSNKDSSLVSYKNLLTTKNLHDIWREMHPNKKQFTYKEISRLDKFLISTNLLQNAQIAFIATPGIKTDHKYVSICLDLDKSDRGPGRWKMNTSILNDNAYKNKIRHLLSETQEEYKTISKQLLWEICKIKIKEFSITYCKQKQQVKRNLMKELEEKIKKKEVELEKSNYNKQIVTEKELLDKELHALIHKQNIGAQIRSRAKWTEQGERSTKYFFSLEKENIVKNTIKRLKREDGTYTNSDSDIIEEGVGFYEKLYSKENINDNDIKSYLNDINDNKKLNDNERESLEGKITDKECKEAIQKMKNNKSPGSDGLPVEFYKVFWPEIKKTLIDSLNYAYDNGQLSATQKRGLLSLLFKKNDRQLLKNWRPISLLNTDYKILAHVLTRRLKSVISNIIHTDQNGYIKGRNIAYNIRLIEDVIEKFENDNAEGAIIFLDFHKAFDTVNHTFLHLVLKKYNFGESFIKWVKTMYNQAESCLSNNGWTSKPFHIQRGIRQGCPLSALLFLLVVEILADKIRKNKNDGLEIKFKDESKFIQLTQLADDTTIFLKNENAVINCLKTIKEFGKFSGLKLNLDKTEGLWLGQGENRNDNLGGLNWKNTCIKALGVHFGYNKHQIEELNWKNKIDKIKKILNRWKYRDLTFHGRILIIKTLALSQVVYLVSSLCVPSWVINELNKEFFSFVWKYKRDKICRKVLINDIDNGGMGMIDFKAFCLATKAVWAARLHNSENETWKIIPRKYMEECSINTLLSMNMEKKNHIPLKLPPFYHEVISGWISCGGGLKAPQGQTEIRKQMIWGNKYIQSKGKTLFYKMWHKNNINFIDDLLDETGKFKRGEIIFQQLKNLNRSNWIIEYHTLLKAIPSSWKETLTNCHMGTKVKKEMKPFIETENKIVYNLPSKTKDYYNILVRKIRKKSYIQKYWDNTFINKPTWNDIWTHRIKLQSNKQLADFHFKLLHKILPSQENLHKWKLSNTNMCRFGCDSVENYQHLFITCHHTRHAVEKIEQSLHSLGFTIKLTYKILILGYKEMYQAYNPLNTLLSLVFFSVYKYWIHNNAHVSITAWIYSYLNLYKNIFKELQDKKTYKLFEDVLTTWD